MDLFDLVAKITLDSSEYERGLDKASGQTSSFGDKLKSGFATAGKVAAAGLAAGGAAVVSLGKQAIEAYADYEQLVGGVETLFKDSAGTVQEYAANAYKTAGLSANEYMETVTSFSASLLQSLGGDTEQAAKIGDMAITDMADNANKMGTSMESISVAYAGFAKQNYTMLDNLKLGYGGTKEEMDRLLADATTLSGVKYDISNLSDVYEAIHVIQTELEITGTTSKEASTTISGSLASTKSAWQNLIVGVADENANFEELVNNFVESASTAAENILPRVEQALIGVGQLVEELAPVIVNALPVLIENVLPSILDSAGALVMGLVTGILDNLPKVLEVGLSLLENLAQGIGSNLSTLIPTIIDVVMKIVETLTSPESLNSLINGAISLILGLADGFIRAMPRIIQSIPVIISNVVHALVRAIPQIISAGVQLFVALVTNLPTIIVEIVKAIPQIIDGIVSALAEGWEIMKEAGKNLLTGLWNGISEAGGWLWQQVRGFLGDLWDGILDFFGIASPSKEMAWVGEMLVDGLGNSIKKNGGEAVDAAEKMSEDILSTMDDLSNNDFGANIDISKNVSNDLDKMESSFAKSKSKSASAGSSSNGIETIPIIVQCVLDGQIVSENTTMWQRKMARAVG